MQLAHGCLQSAGEKIFFLTSIEVPLYVAVAKYVENSMPERSIVHNLRRQIQISLCSPDNLPPVSYTHLTLPTNREV